MDGVERKTFVQTQRKVSILDMVLRVLALILTLAAAIVLGMNKQTKIVPIKIIATLPPVSVPVPARWHYLSAFTYHVVTNAIACAYAAISLLLVLVIYKGGKSRGGLVIVIIVLDLTMVALLSSGNGAAGAVGIIGRRGNSHVQWKEVCSVFGKFCDRVAASVLLSLLGSLAFFFLVAFGALRLKKLN
ncbi:hypothetical protein Ddye_021651 [Dipteronia dyeriana]|uniref:CASP-like protein n=1 Tax=Dipteronia dyeriana TaxID=168575 RepID=A0AAD9WX29_9ROSI|nr:hypothetical protein Ddye_021651 [Dipteronia dyeriana]